MSIMSLNFITIILTKSKEFLRIPYAYISGARGISKPMSATCMNMEG